MVFCLFWHRIKGGSIMYNVKKVTKIYTGLVQVTEDLPCLKIFIQFQEEFPTTPM